LRKRRKMMAIYLIDVRHMDRYEIEADTADEAINRAKDCVADNYGALYFDGATFDAIRMDIPTVGDPSDAGMDGA
jgi:hypothetical protein